MGYRLNIKALDYPDLQFYGTKLYGYVPDVERLPSVKYLVQRCGLYLDGIGFEYGARHSLTMNAKAFSEWARLYEKDYLQNSEFGRPWVTLDGGIVEKIIASDGDKIIWWD